MDLSVFIDRCRSDVFMKHAKCVVSTWILTPHRNLHVSTGVTKLFWFKPPLALKIFHAPPPSTVLGNQVTNCKKWRIMKIEQSLKIIYFWEIHCQ
jgi:hypothetical protein